MNYESFCIRVSEEILDYLPKGGKYHVHLNDVLKNNGVALKAISIQNELYNLAPVIYLESYYQQYEIGRYMPNILKDIADTYISNRIETDFDISIAADFEKAKSRIVRRLVNYEANKEALEDRPYMCCEDMAIIYAVEVGDPKDDNAAVFAVSNQILDSYGVTLEVLDMVAKQNTKELYGVKLGSLEDLIFLNMKKDIIRVLGIDEEQAKEICAGSFVPEIEMYYLTNDKLLYGAVNILDEDIMDELAKKVGDKFCVIPSSVHEVIIIPFSGDYDDVEYFESMIKTVNMENLETVDILSDKMYMVDAVNHVLLRMDRAEEYFEVLDREKEMEKKRDEVIREEMKGQEENVTPVSIKPRVKM